MPLMTPDRRHIIVRGRLWRAANPGLAEEERARIVSNLMDARRAVKMTRVSGDRTGEDAANRAVEEVKVGLGERGAVCWTDGAPDLNRKMARNTVYADWFAEQRERG